MDGLKEWSMTMCIVSVCSAFVVFLIPEGSMKKNVNFVVSLFLLSVMIIPVVNKGETVIELPDISFDNFRDEVDYEIEYNLFLIESCENIAEEKISETLNYLCEKDFYVEVLMQDDSDGNIVFSEITVFISENETVSAEIIRNKVLYLTGITPQVVIES